MFLSTETLSDCPVGGRLSFYFKGGKSLVNDNHNLKHFEKRL